MRCLRRIAHVRWQEKKPNTEVLQICGIAAIEAFLLTVQLRWTGHVVRMSDHRLPKIICYSEQGTRSCGGQRKRFKDCLEANLKKCDIEPNELEDLAADRSGWRSLCKGSVQHFEANRIQYLEAKRSQRKSRSTLNNTDFQCDVCRRACASRIGLYANRRSHL